jgi:hypothetical protein
MVFRSELRKATKCLTRYNSALCCRTMLMFSHGQDEGLQVQPLQGVSPNHGRCWQDRQPVQFVPVLLQGLSRETVIVA